ncbi:hypothetical protein SARC_00103 [Sphaeroforma arctica JP610]|uniref:Uncharacterized protein n=1 Tax=Sphaeroforma arctica JP610 TaxID=667725 RepID=A0A0L0GG83_9EUKA|nr:hypothetical protein SARC_00103 [Sphaeroforma arctica JP610]KNC87846.1 hypothetical protein SARC_00103 [Sphaeroforma arctica JP610]|eukprot:XP_014161748.1 hypothetical protein SARC_00103 [Sphaeroforma arctica JP610]
MSVSEDSENIRRTRGEIEEAREEAKQRDARLAFDAAYTEYLLIAEPLVEFYKEHDFFKNFKIAPVSEQYFVPNTLPVPISSDIVQTLSRSFQDKPISAEEKELLKTPTDVMRFRSAMVNGLYIGMDGLPYVFNVHNANKPTLGKLNRVMLNGRSYKFNWKSAAVRPFFSPSREDYDDRLMYIHSNGTMFRVAKGNMLNGIQTYRWIKIPVEASCGDTKVGSKPNEINFTTKGCTHADFREFSRRHHKSSDKSRTFALDWRETQFGKNGGMIVARMIRDEDIEDDLEKLAAASLYPDMYTRDFTARPIQHSLDFTDPNADFKKSREMSRLYRSVRLGKSMIPPSLDGNIIKAGTLDLTPGGDMMVLQKRSRPDKTPYLKWMKVRHLKIKLTRDQAIVRFAVDDVVSEQKLKLTPEVRDKLERFVDSPKYFLQHKTKPRAQSQRTTKKSAVLGTKVKASEVSRKLKTGCKPTVADNMNLEPNQYANVLTSPNSLRSHMRIDDLTSDIQVNIEEQKKTSLKLSKCRRDIVPPKSPKPRRAGSQARIASRGESSSRRSQSSPLPESAEDDESVTDFN